MPHRAFRTTRKVTNLQGRPGWYRIQNTAGAPVQVTIYDEIGFLGVSADSFLRDLAGVTGDIEMHINSPGGDVFDGIAIYNQLKQRGGVVSVVVDGLAASAASFIAQAASPGRLAMAPHSQMMIHDGFGMTIGNAADMRQMADLLDKASDNIAGIYADRTGKPAAHWRDKMRSETWLSDAEAVAEGLADHVLGQESPQNQWDLSVYANAVLNADGNHAPMTGTHAHSHPAYGAQDGDASHAHEHSHDGDASHSHDHPLPDAGDDGAPPVVENAFRGQAMPGGCCDMCGPDCQCAAGMANRLLNADKYNADDRKKMAGSGQAMPDGSYPIADEEDLDNAIHAVGRGGADHDSIRAHIIKRAAALSLSSKIPDNWNSDGSLKTSAGNLSATDILAMFTDQPGAGKEK